MPPKRATTSQLTILKCKRIKTTYVIQVLPGALTVDVLKQKIISSIEGSGGLELTEVIEDPEEADIPVPKSEFADDDDIDSNVVTSIALHELRLAVPKDKANPYDNQWIEIDDDALLKLSFVDYDLIVFAYQDEEFNVAEASYDE